MAEIRKLRLADMPPRSELARYAEGVLFMIADKVLNEEIEIRSPREAAATADTFFNILRLESNQSTTSVEHLTHEEKRQRILEIQDEVAKRRAARPTTPLGTRDDSRGSVEP